MTVLGVADGLPQPSSQPDAAKQSPATHKPAVKPNLDGACVVLIITVL